VPDKAAADVPGEEQPHGERPFVTFMAWAITALSLYLVVYEGTFAVMLLFAWYINRGLVRHTVEDSFTRNVILEYGAFAVVLIYLFVASYQPGR